MIEDDMANSPDPRRRSGASVDLQMQMQIVEAIQAGLSQYHKDKDTVDSSTVERLREDMRDGFRTVNERLDRVDSNMLQGTSRFAVSDTKIARIEKDIEEMRQRPPVLLSPAIREAKRTENGEEAPVVSQKFRNAIWLGIAGSIGAGVVAVTGLFRPPPSAPPQSSSAPVYAPAPPKAPTVSLPPAGPGPAAP